MRQLQEALQVILAMWTQQEATYAGTYYQVRGAINQPKGVQQPHIPLMIGGGGEQVTLKLVARYGDACNLIGDPATLEHKFAVLKEHCEAVGRDYESIHRTALTLCLIGETDEQARAQIPGWAGAVLTRMPKGPSSSAICSIIVSTLAFIIFAAIVTEVRTQALQQPAGRFQATEEQVPTIPHCLIGTISQMSEDL